TRTWSHDAATHGKHCMSDTKPLDTQGLEKAYYRLYRDFFDQAEKKRRWSLRDDIPWDQCNRAMDLRLRTSLNRFAQWNSIFRTTSPRTCRGCGPTAAGPGSTLTGAMRNLNTPWPWATGCSAPARGPKSKWRTWKRRSSSTNGTCRTIVRWAWSCTEWSRSWP